MLKAAVTVIFCLVPVTVSATLSEFYLDEHCGGHLSLSSKPANAVSLKLTSSGQYDANMNCELSVTSDAGTQIVTSFVMLDIQSFRHCPGDFVQIMDAVRSAYDSDAIRFCGTVKPDVTVVSSNNSVTVRFVSDGDFHGQGFHLILTQFHTGSCSSDEYSCDNGRCIHGDLACDDSEHDNCGDFSDRCRLGMNIIIGIVIGCFLFLVIVVVLSVLVWYRVRLDKDDDGYSPEEGEGSVSDNASTVSSEPPLSTSASVLNSISQFVPRWPLSAPTPAPTAPPNRFWAAVVPPQQTSTPTHTPSIRRAATHDRSRADWSSPFKTTNA